MSNSSSVVLTIVLKLINNYDLHDHVAYPKHHKQSEVLESYCLAAKTKGVFINPAPVEPFSLTLIEATTYGPPIVATKNGDLGTLCLTMVSYHFSWTEHRRNYLSHVEQCRNRHPTTRLEIMKVPDVEDLSLKFSIEGDFKLNGELDATTRQKNSLKPSPRRLP
ncbi:hypothetical protein Pint_06842 [Pistacia integerrima]|uniref:Uncharacterized protein n=1 Tax=Pistacia integerrima TaxID=434235 RepID=A0ACC0XYJ8_9ROSI|nr:hypothetical protein Pint_06842 [Pistacia integerrima]